MKHILTTISVLLGVLISTAQAVTVTTVNEQLCYYNTETGLYDKECNPYIEASGRIAFNEEQTLFVHTIDNMKSTYYVDYQDHTERLEDGTEVNYYWYEVTSDVGNKYSLIIDIKENIVTFINSDKGYFLTYIIKAVF